MDRTLLDREEVARKLARAVLGFQDQYMQRELNPTNLGLLCQVWLPEEGYDGNIALTTKGLPFCVAGTGDLLALFRCISCRFTFATSNERREQLGAPGRVFLTGEPELACNVQHYPREAYLRRAEAEQCQVQSSMLLPLFALPSPRLANSGSSSLSGRPGAALGVIEVVQTSEDMQFLPMVAVLGNVLEQCQLYTSTQEEVQARLPTAASNLALPVHTGLLGEDRHGACSAELADPQQQQQHQEQQQQHQEQQHQEQQQGEQRSPVPQPPPASSDELSEMAAAGQGEGGAGGPADMSDDGEGVGEGEEGDYYDSDTMSGGPKGRGQGRGRGKPGKPGVRLSLEELQGQFGVGLKEAASRLGICPTTLKRACRRHGIQRWPRRALAKVNKALDEMEKRAAPQQGQQGLAHVAPFHGSVAGGRPTPGSAAAAAAAAAAAMSMSLGADTRWTTLANFIPAFHQTHLLQQLAMGSGPITPHMQLLGPHMHPAQLGAGPGPSLPAGAWPPPIRTSPGSAPASSDVSLPDGAVAMGRSGRGEMAAATSGLSDWEGPKYQAQATIAAGVLAATNAAAATLPSVQMPPPLAVVASQVQPPSQLVPSFLRPGHPTVRPLNAGGAAPTVSTMSGVDEPVLRLPQTGRSNADPGGEASIGTLRGLSQISLPSMSFGGPGGANLSLGSAGLERLLGAQLGDDVGLLDSSVLELMLSEDSQGVIGATDEDLARLFGNGGAAAPHAIATGVKGELGTWRRASPVPAAHPQSHARARAHTHTHTHS